MSDVGDSTPPDPYRTGPGQHPPPPPPWGQTPFGQQPGGQQYPQGPAGPPPNYLPWAILSTVFCCLPLGIASIVFAAQVNSKYNSGDMAGAQDSSNKARQFAIWSAIAGVVVFAIYFVAVLASSES